MHRKEETFLNFKEVKKNAPMAPDFCKSPTPPANASNQTGLWHISRVDGKGMKSQIHRLAHQPYCWYKLDDAIVHDGEIGSRVGRNQTTVMRICDRWMQEGTTDRCARSHPPQCTTSRADRQIVRMAVADRSFTSRTVAQHIQSVTHHSVSALTIRRRLQQSEGCRRQNGMKLSLLTSQASVCNTTIMHRHTGPAPGIMVWGGIEYHSRTPLVRIAGTLNSQRYISEVLEPVVLPYLQGLPTAIFQQDNERPHVARIFQRYFVNRQIELLPWPARSPDLSPIENMWSMVAHRLTQLPHQINFGNVWKLLGLLYPKNTSKVPLNQCRGVWQR
ncbi:hypothetical protein LAZ67_5001346 [Cordylochernes scorpioides]|uniref:Tc1-like transposase DDE domain-containing protein n=1 Tax=Cordylochernes scorpioides TaxID=51811 RepID=A0ABY6KFI0_9ARAC|nr:hypothetical protein LAZ67_5001346 [Cordylochernes scorpioides]